MSPAPEQPVVIPAVPGSRPASAAPASSSADGGARSPAVPADAVDVLTSWAPADDEQEALRRRYLTELEAHGSDALRKGARPVHLTASLVVLDELLEHVLLTFHRKARMWLQFGGHVEADDPTLVEAALREGREESGIDLTGARPVPAGLDVHLLGGGFTACREHLDVRFAVAVPQQEPVVSEESLDVAWWPIDDLPDPVGPDVPALLARAVAVCLGA